ncbi:hypothetical protein [Aeribacillus pallidus]|uniref:hypothetical protein n=1 Tax=Aeribacillus pallidus TaxID=33936 RepID=UPI003D1EC6E9
MKLIDHLPDKDVKKLKNMAKEKKAKRKKEKVNWYEIMGISRPTYKRVRGAIRRK